MIQLQREETVIAMVEYKRNDISADYKVERNVAGDYKVTFNGFKPFYFSGALRFRPSSEIEVAPVQHEVSIETIFSNVSRRVSARQLRSNTETFEGKKIYFALTSNGDYEINKDKVAEVLSTNEHVDEFFVHQYGVDFEDLNKRRLIFLQDFLKLCGVNVDDVAKEEVFSQFKLRFVIQ